MDTNGRLAVLINGSGIIVKQQSEYDMNALNTYDLYWHNWNNKSGKKQKSN